MKVSRYQKKNVDRGFVKCGNGLRFKTLNQLEIFGDMTYTYGQNKTSDEPRTPHPPFLRRLALNMG